VEKFIKENVVFGSTVIIDGWSGFNSLGANGYTRVAPKEFEVDEPKNLLPHVHIIVSLLKRWLLGTHQGAVQEMHLQAYRNEYVFRFNRRKSAKQDLLFYRLPENAMRVPPTTYADLTDPDPNF
jgi:hypothetical protein